ncbi:ankyrin repeat domain-containing protein SOWAHC [Nerophis ophidion]|uniref:ankyrin repeat domain-containing protein SOWAHC n=1 Tax=Nerophis ophidion TaxID=159077 RepID=UPI002AE07376|nr:ankyrin repeat domain-containing protein SOWAHC [Nerophis ophidion]
MASRCTLEAVREFLMERGGRVRQTELTDHFAADGSEAALSRIVDALGVVGAEEGGVEFVSLHADRSEQLSAARAHAEGHDQAACNGYAHQTPDNNTGVNRSRDNGPQTEASSPPASNVDDVISLAADPAHLTKTVTTSLGAGEVKLRERRRRESAPVIGVPDPDHHAPGSHGQQVRGARRVSRGSQRAMLTSCLSEDSSMEGLDLRLDINTPKGSRRNFIELMMNSSPQVRRSLVNRGPRLRDSMRSDGDSSSLLSSATDEDCASVTLDPLEHEWMLCASDGLWESLQPLLAVEAGLVAKRDFVTGFTCLHWAAKQGKAELLSRLLTFAKDNGVPVNVNARSSAGYTPLHLAAMHGHTQVVRVLMSDWEADPEARDYSGRRATQYLPVLPPGNPQERGAAKSPGAKSDGENTGGGSWGRGWRFPKVLQGSLNPLRFLNSPADEGTASPEAVGNGRTKGAGVLRKSSLSRLNARLHRGRHRAQIIHSASFRDTGEVWGGEELPVSPVRTRPLSNLFG